MYYIREMDFEDFRDIIFYGFVIALVISVVLLVVGSIIVYSDQGTNTAEQNFYWALQGKEVNDTKATELAQIIRQMYNREPLNWSRAAGVDLNYATRRWEKVLSILENPEAEVKIGIPTWENWFLLAGPVCWLIFASLFSSFYPVQTKLQDYYSDERDRNRWWQYPWRKWWAYPMLLVMLPYVVFTQPAVAIYASVRKFRGIDRQEEEKKRLQREENLRRQQEETQRRREREEQLQRQREMEERLQKQRLAETLVAAKREFQSIVTMVNRRVRTNRREWIRLHKFPLLSEKQNRELKVRQARDRLSRLGTEIEDIQRELAEAEAELNVTNKSLEAISTKTEEEWIADFEKLRRFSLVKAVEVCGTDIRVFTNTIFIEFEEKRYEIGNFLIKIDTQQRTLGAVTIENLCNTSDCGRHHPYGDDVGGYCFGNIQDQLEELLEERDYLTVIVVILQALQTAQGDSTEKIQNWKEVEE